MSRAWFPRRLPAGLPRLLAAMAAGALAWGGGSAGAQDPGTDPRALTILGNDPSARACHARVSSGDISDQVIATCERALTNPRLTRASEVQLRGLLGLLHLRRQEGQTALREFDAALALDRSDAETIVNRGAALLMLRQFGPAVGALTEGLSLGVREPHKAYFNRGAAREALGDLRGAYEDYSTALEIQPDWGPANAELARFARSRQERLATVLGETAPTP